MRALALMLLAMLSFSVLAQEAARYTCPMHPHYVADHAGNCPICGMELVEVRDEAPATREPGTVQIASQTLQIMGVRTALATLQPFGRDVRAFGRIVPSTRLETVVASRVEGWIEALAVTAEGDKVQSGDLLYHVYSPELIAAQRDYLAALTAGATSRTESAQRRLRSLGLQEGSIASLRKSAKLIERVPVVAETDGVVSILAARSGAYVKPGDTIMHLQGYAQVWVMASIAEQDLEGIVPDAEVSLSFPAIPGAPQRGSVDYVYPTVDPTTRTGQVRIVVANPQGRLKPGAYVDVVFTIDSKHRLAVPGEALLRDSRGAHVVVALGEGRFSPRSVVTGISAAGNTEILQGLEAGDRVVVSAQFLLDSETNLREGLMKLTPSDDNADQSQHTGHGPGAH